MAIVQTNVNYTSRLNNSTIEALQENYPFIEVKEIGRSVLETPILAMKMGIGRQKVFYNASFHANEWITTPVLLRFAEELAEAYSTRFRL